MRTGRVALALLPAICGAQIPSEAAQREQSHVRGPSTTTHVRGVKRGRLDATVVIRAAAARSPTVRALLQELEGSSVIVIVELREDVKSRTAFLRFLGTGQNVRYVYVVVSAFQSEAERTAMLAHELRHAVEIARAPEAITDQALRDLFRRIGFETRAGRFDTDAAHEVYWQALREAWKPRAATGRAVR